MSGWTNIHTDKTLSENLPHAKIVARHLKEFGITEQEIRNAIESRNRYRRSVNKPEHDTSGNLEDVFHELFDGHYGRFYDDGWIRWHYDRLDVTFMDITSSIDTLQNGWDHIREIAQKYDPESVIISNMHGDLSDAPGSLHLALDGEDVKQGNFAI